MFVSHLVKAMLFMQRYVVSKTMLDLTQILTSICFIDDM